MNKKKISAVLALALTISSVSSLGTVVNAEEYSGTLAIGQSVKFDFGSADNVADGYLAVDASRDYTSDIATENGLTYGFLGLGETGYSVSEKTDGFRLLEGSEITLANGGATGNDAESDNVYALKTFLSSENGSYDMAAGVMPVRFALKSDQHSYYKVTATVGCADTSKSANVSLYNEKRHPVFTNETLSAGTTKTVTFYANVMDVEYKTSSPTKYSDDMLNIIVAGENVGLASLEITRLDPEADDAPTTIWVCSDSTGCDQPSFTPFFGLQNFSGVGQGLSKYLTNMTVSNQGEGGLASNDNLHFNSAVNQMKAGDYLYVEYGHNESGTDNYKSNLEKYYTAATEKDASLIVVGPIDRIQSGRWNGSQWTSSLSGYSAKGKEFVEEKIAAGATNIAFIDLNEPWINFLNSETNRVAEKRVALGLDTEKKINTAAVRYYYTFNKRGSADATHINDMGAEQAAYMFYKAVADAVAAGSASGATESQKAQAAVLAPIAADVNGNTPNYVSDEIIAAGWAPNSMYPANYTARIEYPYSLNIKNITLNDDGTLKDAEVHVLQDITEYASVYVTAYDENNTVLGVIAGNGGNGRIDNTADTAGAVKTLTFDSDIVPHHFSAVMYYCDEKNEPLTTEGYTDEVSSKYESVKEIQILENDDFESYTDVKQGASLFEVSDWSSHGSMSKSVTKKVEDNGNTYANIAASGGNSGYFWKSLDATATTSTKYELSLRFRYNSGSGTLRLGNSYNNNTRVLSISGTTMKIGSTTIGTINSGEWIDVKVLFDQSTGEVVASVGGYAVALEVVDPNSSTINKLLVHATDKESIDIDIDDIVIREVETYNFPKVEISDPTDMVSDMTTNLMFGGESVSGEYFFKKDGAYKTGSQALNYDYININRSANVYINMNVAVTADSQATYTWGQGRNSALTNNWYAMTFTPGEDVGVSTPDTSGRKINSTFTLVPEKWYNIYVAMNKQSYAATITVTDITGNNTVVASAELDSTNCTFNPYYMLENANYESWVTTGDVYISNAYLYNKPINITTDNANVTATVADAMKYAGHKGDVTLNVAEGYEIDAAKLGDIEATANDDGTWTLAGVEATDTPQVVNITRIPRLADITNVSITADNGLVKFTKGKESTVNLTVNATDADGVAAQFDESDVTWNCDVPGVNVENGVVTFTTDFVLAENLKKDVEVKAVVNGIEAAYTITVYTYAFYENVKDGKTTAEWDGSISTLDGKDCILFSAGTNSSVSKKLILPEIVSINKTTTTIKYSNAYSDNTAGQYRYIKLVDSEGNNILEQNIYYDWNSLVVGSEKFTGAITKSWTDVIITLNEDGSGTVTVGEKTAEINVKDTAKDIAEIHLVAAKSAPSRPLGITDIIISQAHKAPTVTGDSGNGNGEVSDKTLQELVDDVGESKTVTITLADDQGTVSVPSDVKVIINEPYALTNSALIAESDSITVEVIDDENTTSVTASKVVFDENGKITDINDGAEMKTSYTDANDATLSDIGFFKTKTFTEAADSIKYTLTNNHNQTGFATFDLGTTVSSGDVLFGLFITGIPEDEEITSVTID